MSSYWLQMHSDKIGNKDFIEGIEAAVEAFGIHRDGRREIGSPEREVNTVIAEVKRDLGYNNDNNLNPPQIPLWHDNVVEGVNKIIKETLSLENDIQPNDLLFENLHADSLDKVEILLAIESHFNISISDSQAEKVETIADIYNGVSEKLLNI